MPVENSNITEFLHHCMLSVDACRAEVVFAGFYFLILFLFLNPYGPTCGKCCSPLHLTLSLSEAAGSYLAQGYLRHLTFSSRETRSTRHYMPKSQNKNMLPNVTGRNRAIWFLISLFPEDVSLWFFISSWSVWYLVRETQREPLLQRWIVHVCAACMTPV